MYESSQTVHLSIIDAGLCCSMCLPNRLLHMVIWNNKSQSQDKLQKIVTIEKVIIVIVLQIVVVSGP